MRLGCGDYLLAAETAPYGVDVIVVTGTFGGATRYMAHLLTAFQIPIGHEKRKVEGQRGVSSFAWAARESETQDMWYCPGKRPAREAIFLIHVVRHPVRCAATCLPDIPYNTKPGRLTDRSIQLPKEPLLKRSALYWARWHSMIQKQRPDMLLKAETAEAQLTMLLGRRPLTGISRTMNTRTTARVSHDDIRKALDPFEYAEWLKAAEFFGYDVMNRDQYW
jgi:hypothetical protein